MGIFKSSLFQALLDIQEFYEVTLLNSQKSCEQKIEEANQVAQKWEKTSLLTSCHDNLQKSAEQNQGKCPAQNCSVEGPAWMPVHHCTLSQPHVTTGRTVALTIRTFVNRVMCLLYNTLTRFVITFLPGSGSNHLLISWLQSPSAVIFQLKKRNSHCFHPFPFYLP
ncbi:uncharacterized protein LOC129652658 isoform X4 [Bubalus kerabau]|nr:uncharacterized protein LOC129652658 isoform X4 [Bubalus carabanensis]